MKPDRVLEREGIDYDWIDLDSDPLAVQRVLEINGGRRTVPTIVFPDGQVLVEPSPSALVAALRKLMGAA